MKFKLYALRHKESHKLMNFIVSSNGDAEFCNSCSVELTQDQDEVIWVTSEYEHAVKVVNETVQWYNSSVYRPMNPFVGKLEIVEFCAHGVM